MHRIVIEALLLLQSPITWFSFVLGALLGSFFNVCIHRIPRRIFFAKARSACPRCQKEIPIWRNIPILTWLLQRGRAACCGQRIAFRYLAVELASGILFVTIYWCFPFVNISGSGLIFDSLEMIRCAHALAFGSLLLVGSVIDLEHQIIPDVLTLPMIALSPLVVFLHPELTWKSSLLGVLLGGGSLYGVAWLYYMVRRDYGLGMGDVKLLAGIGGWLGYEAILTTVFWGSILGSLVGIGIIIVTRSMNLKIKLPFGPFLSVAALSYLLFGQTLADYLITF